MLAADNALSAKIKAMYGRRIRSHQYEELARKKSVAEVAAYLRDETVYKTALRGIMPGADIHRGQLEGLLKSAHYSRFSILTRYLGGRRGGRGGFYFYIAAEFEIENILFMIRLLGAGHSERFIPYLTEFPTATPGFSLAALCAVRNYEELAECLKPTPYSQALGDCLSAGEVRYNDCEIALYSYFYGTLRDRIKSDFKKHEQTELSGIFDTYLELSNIGVILRIKRFFPHIPAQEIPKYLIPAGERIPKRFWRSLYESETADDAERIAAASVYAKYAGGHELFVDYDIGRIRRKICRKLLRFSTVSEVIFSAYMTLSLIEISNLTVIIEGIRYALPADEIEKMIVKNN